tara:strand:- start:348 stop:527 length:180 start_codon:yes stop_codon:yes gene_type:complete
MEEITKLVAHYRKKAIGIRSAMSREGVAQTAMMLLSVRAAAYEDVAADLEAFVEESNDN